jgi:hypothetical protein
MDPSTDEILLELTVDLPPEDLDTFVDEVEDYFCGGQLSPATPNLIPDYVELL